MREKIIDTAIEEFTRNGLKFTMNDVAKALGISKKTIYTVFGYRTGYTGKAGTAVLRNSDQVL